MTSESRRVTMKQGTGKKQAKALLFRMWLPGPVSPASPGSLWEMQSQATGLRVLTRLQGCVALALVDLTVVPKWASCGARLPGCWQSRARLPSPRSGDSGTPTQSTQLQHCLLPGQVRSGTAPRLRDIPPSPSSHSHGWPQPVRWGHHSPPVLLCPPEDEVQGFQTPESLGSPSCFQKAPYGASLW